MKAKLFTRTVELEAQVERLNLALAEHRAETERASALLLEAIGDDADGDDRGIVLRAAALIVRQRAEIAHNEEGGEMNAYALATENGAIKLIVVTPQETFEFPLTDPQALADTLRRAMAESEIQNAVLLKPQPKDFQIEGWSV